MWEFYTNPNKKLDSTNSTEETSREFILKIIPIMSFIFIYYIFVESLILDLKANAEMNGEIFSMLMNIFEFMIIIQIVLFTIYAVLFYMRKTITN